MPAIFRMPSFSMLSSRVRTAVLLPLLVIGVLAASTLLVTPQADAASRQQKVSSGLRIALKQVGDRYSYGASGPNAFDCSGLVNYSFRKAGIRNLPRTSDALANRARHIKKKKMRPGDLMFFHNGGNVYHVAIFVRWKHGRRIMVHSPNSGSRVRKESPWTGSWFAGTLR